MTPATSPDTTGIRGRLSQGWRRFSSNPTVGYSIAPVFLVASVLLMISIHNDPNLLTCASHVISNITKEGIPFALMSIGVALVLSTGGVDISGAGVATAAGALFAGVTQIGDGSHYILAGILAILLGTASGATLGQAVSRRAPPLIMSWAVGTLWLTAAVIFAESKSIDGNAANVTLNLEISDTFWTFGSTGFNMCWLFLGISTSVLLVTNIPRQARAIGSDADSAVYAGVRQRPVLMQAYAISGSLAALSGVLWALVNKGGGTLDHAGKELIAVSIAVLGGTAMSGGYLSIFSVAAAGLFWVSISTTLRGLDLTIFAEQQQRIPNTLFAILLITGSLVFGKRLGGATRTIHADYKIKET